jgi:tRNA threonylcarbamoyladenosine biosynthesis protein TsaB
MESILIIETSTEICSLALAVDGQLKDCIESDEGQNHARLTTVFAEQLLRRNGLTTSDLSAVAVSKGPGSYTGLRIGVSTAKGICYASRIPLIAVGTLEAMANHVSSNLAAFGLAEPLPQFFCPMIDARRMEVFSALINKSGEIVKPVTAEIIGESFLESELQNSQIAFFGNGAEKCRSVLHSPQAVFIDQIRASAKYMTELVWKKYSAGQFEDVAYFEPFYLKDFIATVSKKSLLG